MQAHDEESLFDQLSQLADATEASSTNARDASNSIAISDLMPEDPANTTPTEHATQGDSQMQMFLPLHPELTYDAQGVLPPLPTLNGMGGMGMLQPPLASNPNNAIQHHSNVIFDPVKGRMVLCPYCGCEDTQLLGGSTRGSKYAHLCNKCDARWNQLRKPNAEGSYEITKSTRAVGDEPRRSNNYACGKCGAKPKKDHICPFRNIDVTQIDTMMPLPRDDMLAVLPAKPTTMPDTTSTVPDPIPDSSSSSTLATNPNKISTPAELQVLTPQTVINKPSTNKPSSITTAISSPSSDDDLAVARAVTASLTLPSETPGSASGGVDTVNNALQDAQDTTVAEEDVTTYSPISGLVVFQLLGLIIKKVKGDGSCWIYAILAAIGLCDHQHSRTEQLPSAADRSRDHLCRMLTVDWLQEQQYKFQHDEDPDEMLRVPQYPMVDGSDYGTFGTTTFVIGLAATLKVTIVMWNETTLMSDEAKQQVILYDAKSGRTSERSWHHMHILEYSLANETIHIEWNGRDHYSARVSTQKHTSVDPTIFCMLQNVVPCTTVNPKSLRRTDSSSSSASRKRPLDEWITIVDGIRADATEIFVTEHNPSQVPVKTLKTECLTLGFNSIIVLGDKKTKTQVVKYAKFPFTVTAGDCAVPQDFVCRMFVYNDSQSKTRTAPISGCYCNRYFKEKHFCVQCNQCKRWCHQQCTPYADVDLSTSTDDCNYTCPVCEKL